MQYEQSIYYQSNIYSISLADISIYESAMDQ